jgi:tellurite resistance protein TerC
MSNEILFFAGFLVLVLFLLFVDLGLFSKKTYHTVSLRESLFWTSLWVSLSLLFYLFIYFKGHLLHGIDNIATLQASIDRFHGHLNIEGLGFEEALRKYNRNLSLQYITGYVIEYSLSMDNVFVILLIFLSFKVPEQYYKRVLFWGILGAIVMRFLFIFLLSAIIYRAEWVLYIFGAFLIFTAVKMAMDFFRHEEKKIDVEHHPMVRFARRLFPVHPQYEEHKFWLRKNGKLFITPLFIVLLVVEFSDVVFAVDSVPAIFAVTRDPFIVFFSNVFAIMGLRSLFFLISHFFNRFYYLKAGLAALLGFIGVKMLLPPLGELLTGHAYHLETQTSLIIILSILAVSIIGSMLRTSK